jgi:PAS domain S-box-containing protein
MRKEPQMKKKTGAPDRVDDNNPPGITLTPPNITYKTLFERSNDGIFIISDTTVVDANNRALAMFGCDKGDLLGKRLTDISPPYQTDGVASAVLITEKNKKLDAGETQRFPWLFLRPDRSRFIAEVILSLLPSPQGNMIMAAMKDITEESKLKELFENMYRINPIPTMLTNLDNGLIVDVNESFASIFGFTRDEAIGKTSIDIGIWESMDERQRYFDLSADERQIRDYRVMFRNKQGEQISLLLNSAVLHYNGVKVLMTMAQDVTKLRQAEMSLRTIFEENPFGLFIAELSTGRIIDANKRYLQMTGYRKDEILGHIVSEFGELPRSVLEKIAALLGMHGNIDNQEAPFVRKDRKEMTILISIRSIQFEGRPVALIAFQDITSQKQAELALRKSEEKYSKLFSASPDFVALSDLETGLMLEANNAFNNLLGYSHENILGKTVHELNLWVNPEDRSTVTNELRTNGEIDGFPTKFRTGGGSAIDVLISAKAIDVGGRKHMITVIKDVSELVNMEKHLRNARKLEAVGRLAGGVSHDFNNMLEGLSRHIGLAMSIIGQDNPAIRNLETAQDIMNRAKKLSNSLLAFSRRQALNRNTVSVRDTIKGLDSFWRKLVGDNIELSLDLKDDAKVNVDSLQIEQVLTNMIINARDAMPNGGKLTVATELEETDKCLTAQRRKSGPAISITISDTGVGMSKEVTDRIFDPFFTTKTDKQGRGLGLSIAYGIIMQHGGSISVSSSLGAGSQFRISLPTIAGNALPGRQDHGETAAERASVLLAEQDNVVRDLNRRFLEKSGYVVYEASDGEEALRIFGDNAGALDLVILDMIMAKKNGREVFDEIKLLKPSMKVLFISGYTNDYINERAALGSDVEIMLKPLSPYVLLNKVRETINN